MDEVELTTVELVRVELATVELESKLTQAENGEVGTKRRHARTQHTGQQSHTIKVSTFFTDDPNLIEFKGVRCTWRRKRLGGKPTSRNRPNL